MDTGLKGHFFLKIARRKVPPTSGWERGGVMGDGSGWGGNRRGTSSDDFELKSASHFRLGEEKHHGRGRARDGCNFAWYMVSRKEEHACCLLSALGRGSAGALFLITSRRKVPLTSVWECRGVTGDGRARDG